MDAMARYYGEIPTDQVEKLCRYHLLISEWNTKVNLISRKDIENFWSKHIIPCLSINKVVRFKPEASVVDVGTGGGLPGIPLAIANGGTNFTLVDSIGKKALAVDDMAKKLALKRVKVRNSRVEEVAEKFDYIVARAVANLTDFLKNVSGLCKKDTQIFYIRGSDFGGELQGISNFYVHNIGKLLDDDDFADKVIVEIRNEK
ncbi:MAG: 16S rRNA (guanine(527)-N(7))-methyltransferase RsmG [Puniceicoccales bacterium]|jgi:16S rRNA (guanine527-N7)-methyltransferase|nr:16S rRNA (guanine(527)-N(7))-methyltransferase RsmG [Puniceicoccales bacterium]